MVKSQTVVSINKLVASMSSLMHWFAAIAGSIREKTKMDITRPPINGYLFLFFSWGEHVLTTGWKKFYQHTVTSRRLKLRLQYIEYPITYVTLILFEYVCGLWCVCVKSCAQTPPLPPPPLVIAPLSFLFCPGSTSLPGSFRPIPCSQRKSENLCDIVKKICEKVIGKWFWRRIEFSVKRYVRCLCRPRSVLFVLISTKVCEN